MAVPHPSSEKTMTTTLKPGDITLDQLYDEEFLNYNVHMNYAYERFQELFLKLTGLKDGDLVTISHTVEAYLHGWSNVWVCEGTQGDLYASMDRYVNQLCIVGDLEFATEGGCGLPVRLIEHRGDKRADGCDYKFPFFVIKKL